MPVYWVTVNGENFLLDVEGTLAKHGFFTHRCVTAANPDEAERTAIEVVRQDERLRPLVKNSADDPPTMKLEAIAELGTFDPDCPKGFVWYQMRPKRWWQFWRR
jgi:hypothetical protein